MVKESEALREWREATPDEDSDRVIVWLRWLEHGVQEQRADTEVIEESSWRGSKRSRLRPVGRNTTFSQAATVDSS